MGAGAVAMSAWSVAGGVGMGAVWGWIVAGFDVRRARSTGFALAGSAALGATCVVMAGAPGGIAMGAAAVAAFFTREMIEWRM